MFEGVPDQFHPFIASRTTSVVLPLPLSFPLLHGSSNSSIPTFVDPYTTSTAAASQQLPLQTSFLQPLTHQGNSPVLASKNEEKKDNDNNTVGMNLEIDQKERLMPESVNPWTNDEVLALLRIRSSLENWFPEFTWEYVSRKLAEVGFNKRSAEKCKEKFEEESRYFGSNINYNKNNNNNNNYRVFSEFEEIYDGDRNPNHHPHHRHQDVVTAGEKNKKMDNKTSEQLEERDKKMGQNLGEETRLNDLTVVGEKSEDNSNIGKVEKSKNRRRKREKKFEIFKGFCQDIVNKMMCQQEEMHNKLLEDMVKRDEEKFARGEAWKKQEMDRINAELQLRAQEQAVASDRQASLINFLKIFTSTTESSSVEVPGERSHVQDLVIKVPLPKSSIPSTSSSLVLPQNPNPTSQAKHNQSQHEKSASLPPKTNISLTENQAPRNPSHRLPASNISKVPTSSTLAPSPQNPNSVNNQSKPPEPTTSLSTYKAEAKSTSNERDNIGKRWPRDEVLALINLRCSLYNNNNADQKEGSAAKAPLWERISQGMLELGYKRSAKRCKEKWENINKYFRKTKDNVNKKRSIDSRTCPYFHQLSTLYNGGTLVAPDQYHSPKNQSNTPETGHINNCSSRNGNSNSPVLHNVAEGGQKKNMFQVPAAFDFDF